MLPREPSRSAIVLYGRAAFDRAQSLPSLAEALPDRLDAAHRGARIAIAIADLTGPSLPDGRGYALLRR